MKVYQLTVEGFNSDRPTGCIYERGEEKVLATPYGEEPIEWLAKHFKKTVDEILVEKAVTGEKLALFKGIAFESSWVYKTAKQLTEKEAHLTLLERMGNLNECEQIEEELESLETALNYHKQEVRNMSRELLSKHCTHLNYANLKDNLKLSLPFDVQSTRNYIKIYVDIVPEVDNYLKETVHGIYDDKSIYDKDGVRIIHHALYKSLYKNIRVQLRVLLPLEDKPKLNDHLEPMTDAIENYIVEQGFILNE